MADFPPRRNAAELPLHTRCHECDGDGHRTQWFRARFRDMPGMAMDMIACSRCGGAGDLPGLVPPA